MNNMRQIRNINSPGGNVGRHQKTQGAAPHPRHDFFPHALGQIGTEFIGIITEALQDNGKIMNGIFCVAKDDSRGGIFDFNDAHQRPFFAHARHNIINMFDFGDMDLITA